MERDESKRAARVGECVWVSTWGAGVHGKSEVKSEDHALHRTGSER